MLSYQHAYPQLEEASAPPPPTVHNKDSSAVVSVKAKLRNRFRQFDVPVDTQLNRLTGTLKERFDMVDETGANVMTAYMLWLFFGFFGVHRWYLKQHNATSFCIWFFTAQFFGIGWLCDGIMMVSNVTKFNSRTLYQDDEFVGKASGCSHLLFGFKGASRPNMFAAYCLWFFFGWMGIHRWYTGHHTPSSFLAWLLTGNILGCGWLYDAYYTHHMVNFPKLIADSTPFYIKVLEKYDYMPISSDLDLQSYLRNAATKSDRTVRLLSMQEEEGGEGEAYLLWFCFGLLGGHAFYLNMELLLMRFFTGNFFVIGWIADGIRLGDEIDRASGIDKKIEGDFSPSLDGTQYWPTRGMGPVALGASSHTYEYV